MSRTAFTLLGLPVLAVVLLAAMASPTRPGESRSAAAQTSSFRFAKNPAGPSEAEPAAPIRLTASDGTGLALVALEANGVLEPPLAFTELHLTFENPRDERDRGALPDRPAAGRGAQPLRHEDRRRLAGGRGRRAAGGARRPTRTSCTAGRTRRCWSRRRATSSPPASSPSRPAGARRSSSPTRTRWRGGRALRPPPARPLRGRPARRPRAPRRPARHRRAGEQSRRRGQRAPRGRAAQADWTPDRDFEIGQDRVAAALGLRDDNLVVARISPRSTPSPQEIAGLYVLVDSSASRALGYADPGAPGRAS